MSCANRNSQPFLHATHTRPKEGGTGFTGSTRSEETGHATVNGATRLPASCCTTPFSENHVPYPPGTPQPETGYEQESGITEEENITAGHCPSHENLRDYIVSDGGHLVEKDSLSGAFFSPRVPRAVSGSGHASSRSIIMVEKSSMDVQDILLNTKEKSRDPRASESCSCKKPCHGKSSSCCHGRERSEDRHSEPLNEMVRIGFLKKIGEQFILTGKGIRAINEGSLHYLRSK